MKGLELAKEYYNFYGKSMIHEKFPEFENRIAVGLVGHGSECYGFDDSISQDHDFGPAFCMWLTEEDYEKIGSALAFEYEQLPKDYAGFTGRVQSTHGGGRVGVFSISSFYYSLIGVDSIPKNNKEWVWIPESRLAVATNGEVFRDDYGMFSKIREGLLQFYPEDVRIKKIVARAAAMAQSGQYNYARSMRRMETVTAHVALSEFVKNTASMVFLLNKKYMPFYKWMHKGIFELDILWEIAPMLTTLCEQMNQKHVWSMESSTENPYEINLMDKNVEMIETICGLVVEELNRQGISSLSDRFLENHTGHMMEKISDIDMKRLQILEG